jgi:preprotein translocase subunit SecD
MNARERSRMVPLDAPEDFLMKITIVFFAASLAITDLASGANPIVQVDTDKRADDLKKIAPEVTAQQSRRGQTQKPQIGRSTSLEFAVLANERKHKDIIRQAKAGSDAVLRQNGKLIAAWREVAWENKQGGGRKQKPVYADVASETVQREVDRNGQKVRELLVVYEPPEKRLTGQYLARVNKSLDAQGMPAVELSFNRQGAALLYRFTSDHAPLSDGFWSRMAILIDDQIILAPQVNEPIRDSVIIQGHYTTDERDQLLDSLLRAVPQKQGDGKQ